jgi:rare lipoprotein A
MKLTFTSAALTVSLSLLLGACSGSRVIEQKDGGPDRHVDLKSIPDAVPRAEAKSRYGNPDSYEVFGKSYRVMDSSSNFVEQGVASWYGNKFHGRRTSSGEPYDMYKMTAAHKHLPLPTYVEVTNLENGRKVVVKVNDRGPFHQNRIIDLSYVAAAKLGIIAKGTGLVEIRAIDTNRPATTAAALKTGNTTAGPASQPTVTITHSKIHPNPEIYIQAGAFGSRDNALRLQSRLQTELGKPVRVASTEVNSKTFYRVQVGPMLDVTIADEVSISLEKLGISNLTTVIE